MDVLLRLKKKGITYIRNASAVLYAKADGPICHIYFTNGETFDFAYCLKTFEKIVTPTALFLRVHDSYIVRMDAIVGKSWLQARLSNGISIPLNRKANLVVKKLLEEKCIPPSGSSPSLKRA